MSCCLDDLSYTNIENDFYYDLDKGNKLFVPDGMIMDYFNSLEKNTVSLDENKMETGFAIRFLVDLLDAYDKGFAFLIEQPKAKVVEMLKKNNSAIYIVKKNYNIIKSNSSIEEEDYDCCGRVLDCNVTEEEQNSCFCRCPENRKKMNVLNALRMKKGEDGKYTLQNEHTTTISSNFCVNDFNTKLLNYIIEHGLLSEKMKQVMYKAFVFKENQDENLLPEQKEMYTKLLNKMENKYDLSDDLKKCRIQEKGKTIIFENHFKMNFAESNNLFSNFSIKNVEHGELRGMMEDN